MPDERNARPVSGEIMAAPPAGAEPAESRPVHPDVVDAEFETLQRQAPAEPAQAQPVASIGTVAAPVHGLDSLRKPDARARPQDPARGGPVFWIFGLGLVAGAFWVSGGHALIRQAPSTSASAPAQPVVNPVRIAEVASRVEDHGGRAVLFVEGKAVNEGSETRTPPPLEINVTGNDGKVRRYNLGTSPEPLAPGAAFSFSSRLEAPKEGVKSVSVTFRQ
jgi:hypothetical protein